MGPKFSSFFSPSMQTPVMLIALLVLYISLCDQIGFPLGALCYVVTFVSLNVFFFCLVEIFDYRSYHRLTQLD